MSCDAVLTVEQMRAAERAAISAGTSEWELMLRAGEGATQWVARVAGGSPVCILCGPGNNGGDGYVIAESLRLRGNRVNVVAPLPPSSESAKKARQAFKGKVDTGTLPDDTVFVDCLFGYGLSREVEGPFRHLLQQLQGIAGYKIAVDVPSSIASDSGKLLGPVVTYDLTLALGAWKLAHYTMPAMAKLGARRLVDIGLVMPSGVPCMSPAPQIVAPRSDAHKYRRGLLAIVAGEMPGAALLAAQASMRAGAGYVKLLSEHSHPDAPAELVVVQGELTDTIEDERISAILIGPGLGRGKLAEKKLERVLYAGRPTILDADALHLLGPQALDHARAEKIGLTPHEGELAALCEAFGVDVQSKLDRAALLHRTTGLTVLAKGPDTVLAGKGGVRVFELGSSWLSIAGTGDVLAGIAASRLAVLGDVQQALEEAVWLHHEAARLAGPYFTSGQLSSHVSQAMEYFL